MTRLRWHHPLERSAEDTYFPHPAPGSAGNEEEEIKAAEMATLSLLKTLVIPALISLILYLLISFLIVPLWKRYRGRYSNYLPLDTISTHTTSLRYKIQSALAGLFLPSSWAEEWERNRHVVNASDGTDSDLDEGEELYEVDDNRREALSLDARRGRDDDGRRLSRDLEEGFKDDSDDEEQDIDRNQGVSR